MASHKKSKSPAKGSNKTFASKRTANASGHRGGQGPADQQHDPRRLGSFEGKGEHARTGSRGRQ